MVKKLSVWRWQMQGWCRKHPAVRGTESSQFTSSRACLWSLKSPRWNQYTPYTPSFKYILIFLWQGLEWYTFFRMPDKNSVGISRISYNYYTPRQSHHTSILYSITMFGEKNKLWSSSLYSLLPPLITSAQVPLFSLAPCFQHPLSVQ
jgi:hypothetical protein